MPGASGAFLAALTAPSGLSVGVMAGVAAALFLGLALFVQAVASTGRADLFATDPTDHNAFVSARIAGLSDRPGDPPLLAILGASVTRSSFGPTAEIARVLEARTGQGIEVVNLCTGRQPILSHLALIETLPKARPVTVILGLGPSRFTIDRASLQELYDGDYLAVSGLAERTLAREIGLDPGPATGVALLDDRIFYGSRTTALAKNLVRILLRGRPVQQDEEQWIGRRLSPEAFRIRSDLIMRRFDGAEATLAMNRELLVQTVAFVKSRPNLRLVLIEHPVNPDFISGYLGAARYADHLAFMRDFARAEGLAYWTIGLDLGLGPESFFDWAHIAGKEAQASLRAGLVQRLAELEP
jgi:hypothetical protein